MTNPASLDAIRSLLLTFPGVTSAFLLRDSDSLVVDVRFRCASLESLKEIAKSACWANASVSLSDYGMGLCGEAKPSQDLPCNLRIPDAEAGSPTQTEILGVYLSEVLGKCGLLADKDRQQLHDLWNTELLVKGR
jgi:hypothetical protein